jgi:hypothetical protein
VKGTSGALTMSEAAPMKAFFNAIKANIAALIMLLHRNRPPPDNREK